MSAYALTPASANAAGTPCSAAARASCLAPITNDATGYCLDATGAGTANCTLLEVWYCNGATNQHWTRS